MQSHLWTHLLRSPRTTGSLVPSSAHLARAMADCARGASRVLELGAGTGPVTLALRRHFDLAQMRCVELQPQMAARLQREHPGLTVVHGCALAALRDDEASPGTAVVSSLPFRSLPDAFKTEFLRELGQFLHRCPDAFVVQFTYQPRAPFSPPPGWRWHRGPFVLANFPPARVWVLRKA